MGHDKDKTKQTGSTSRESSQVGTHGQTGSNQGDKYTGKNEYQGQGSQGKGQGQYQGQGLNKDKGMSQGQYQGQGMSQGQASWKQGDPTTQSAGAWNDRSQREMQQGDRTDPAQPSGTSPLDKDQQPINQNRPGSGSQSPR
jgi:hypothetical protein